MTISIDGVKITLTPEQLTEIARQTSKPKSYKDITSFEIAAEHLGVNFDTFFYNEATLTKSEIALRKLKLIVRAMRSFTNWEPDYKSYNQQKWVPYFNGNGFSYCSTSYDDTITYVPSALYLESSEQAKFLGETFVYLFKDYLIED